MSMPANYFITLKTSCTIPEKMQAQSVLEGLGLVAQRYPRSLAEVPEAIRHFFESVPTAPADLDDGSFEEQYAAALALMSAQFVDADSSAPTLGDLKASIVLLIDGDEVTFPSFEDFFQWMDVVHAYEELDTEMSSEAHKLLLQVAYDALVQDGVIVQSESDQATESVASETNGAAFAVPTIVVTALERAEQFIEGFEDDEEQEGIAELLADLRAALRVVTGEPHPAKIDAEKNYCLVFSNYTGNLMAWEGTADQIRKYLGNREIVGAVSAVDEESAMAKWRLINHGKTREGV
ncbi:Uncharacterised protein [Streptococcus pneumoniae]|nr:hypothetical protein BV581_11180 [Stutzerimonas stutzeri]CJL78176.1 Uncharacterised protein [Streptococcus pneumoniae]